MNKYIINFLVIYNEVILNTNNTNKLDNEFQTLISKKNLKEEIDNKNFFI